LPRLKHVEFQFLLYSKFISPLGDEPKHDADHAAREIGISRSTLYNYIEGECYCPPDLISRIYNATGDVDFLNFIVNPTDKRLVDKESVRAEKGLVEEVLDVAGTAGGLVNMVREALADGRLSALEQHQILRGIEGVHKELEDLKACIGGGKGK